MHKYLCQAFISLKPRPSVAYYRDILFRTVGEKLRFVWVHNADKRAVTTQYIASEPTTSLFLQRHHKLSRSLGYKMHVFYLTEGMDNHYPRNKILATMLRFECDTSLERRSLVHGISKESQVDLETSALGPLLDAFWYKARSEAARLRKRLQYWDALSEGDV